MSNPADVLEMVKPRNRNAELPSPLGDVSSVRPHLKVDTSTPRCQRQMLLEDDVQEASVTVAHSPLGKPLACIYSTDAPGYSNSSDATAIPSNNGPSTPTVLQHIHSVAQSEETVLSSAGNITLTSECLLNSKAATRLEHPLGQAYNLEVSKSGREGQENTATQLLEKQQVPTTVEMHHLKRCQLNDRQNTKRNTYQEGVQKLPLVTSPPVSSTTEQEALDELAAELEALDELAAELDGVESQPTSTTEYGAADPEAEHIYPVEVSRRGCRRSLWPLSDTTDTGRGSDLDALGDGSHIPVMITVASEDSLRRRRLGSSKVASTEERTKRLSEEPIDLAALDQQQLQKIYFLQVYIIRSASSLNKFKTYLTEKTNWKHMSKKKSLYTASSREQPST